MDITVKIHEGDFPVSSSYNYPGMNRTGGHYLNLELYLPGENTAQMTGQGLGIAKLLQIIHSIEKTHEPARLVPATSREQAILDYLDGKKSEVADVNYLASDGYLEVVQKYLELHNKANSSNLSKH